MTPMLHVGDEIGFKALSCEQVAELMGLTHKQRGVTICRLAASGSLKGRKVGRTWRFHPQAVQDYLLVRER